MRTVLELPPAVRDALAALPGVETVIVGAGGEGIWLLSEPQEAPVRILRSATEILEDAGIDPAGVPLEVVVSALRRQRRVRFDSAERIENPDRSVSVQVTLEWEGEQHTARITGEKGDQIELRTAAQAALAAVQKVVDQELTARLVGVKHVRAFDGDLIVVSISGGPGQKTLLGAVLAGADPYRATAIGVLMAMNRALGNYLVTR